MLKYCALFLVVLQAFFSPSADQQPVRFWTNIQPQLVTIDGEATAWYEIHFDKKINDSILIVSLKVLHAKNGSAIAVFDQQDLNQRVVYKNTGTAQNLVYVELNIGKEYQQPLDVIHEFEVDLWTAGVKRSLTLRQLPLTLLAKQPVIFASPFKEGNWAAVYHPMWERGHRRVLYADDQKHWLPGRFAIDFIKLDEQGRYARQNEDSISNWYAYGIPVSAVADGVVTAVRKDFKESPTISGHPRYDSKDGTGNYVSVKIDGGNFVFYEHLQPGSIQLMPGDTVKRGEKIGAVGFTGQSTGPHLHLHLANGNMPLFAEGLPFVFEQFTILGRYDDFAVFGKKKWNARSGNAEKATRYERPGPNTVVRFR